jgi:protein CpxP
MTVGKLIAIGVSALMLTACAARHHAQSSKHPERAYKLISSRVDSVLDEVDASAAQRDKVHDIKDQVYGDFKTLRKSVKKANLAAFEELKKDDPDAKKLHALVDDRMDEMRDAMHEAADSLIELHGVLSPKQRQELTDMLEERVDAFREPTQG